MALSGRRSNHALLLLVALAVVVSSTHAAWPIRDGTTPAPASDRPDRRRSVTVLSLVSGRIAPGQPSKFPVCGNASSDYHELTECRRQRQIPSPMDPDFEPFDELGFANFKWKRIMRARRPPLLISDFISENGTLLT